MHQRITRSSAAEQASGNSKATKSKKANAERDAIKANAKGLTAATAKKDRGRQKEKEKEKEEITSRKS